MSSMDAGSAKADEMGGEKSVMLDTTSLLQVVKLTWHIAGL